MYTHIYEPTTFQISLRTSSNSSTCPETPIPTASGDIKIKYTVTHGFSKFPWTWLGEPPPPPLSQCCELAIRTTTTVGSWQMAVRQRDWAPMESKIRRWRTRSMRYWDAPLYSVCVWCVCAGGRERGGGGRGGVICVCVFGCAYTHTHTYLHAHKHTQWDGGGLGRRGVVACPCILCVWICHELYKWMRHELYIWETKVKQSWTSSTRYYSVPLYSVCVNSSRTLRVNASPTLYMKPSRTATRPCTLAHTLQRTATHCHILQHAV